MGCDIHLFVEKKTKDGWSCIYDEGKLYSNRSYSLFSILADVRNDGDFIPISEPKGIPDDASSSVKGYMEDWGCDIHSKSFLTVQELLEYDWTQCVEQTCYMTKKDYIYYKDYQKYSPNCIPSDVKHFAEFPYIEDSEYETTYNKFTKDKELKQAKVKDTTVGIKVNYRIMYSQYLTEFYTVTLPILMSECNGDFNSVRIVFGFDN